MKRFLDTNIIIRYLLDGPEASAIEKILKGKVELILPDIIIAETVWTLLSHYKWGKEKIIPPLQSLLRLESIQANKNTLLEALQIYSNHNIDYVDAYLAVLMKKEEANAIYSLDRDFDKIPSIRRVEPK